MSSGMQDRTHVHVDVVVMAFIMIVSLELVLFRRVGLSCIPVVVCSRFEGLPLLVDGIRGLSCIEG
jgi:hypothetical protein